MPIRGLDYFLLNKTAQHLPMQVIEDTTVAIDGFWFLKKYSPVATKEALLDYRPLLEAVLAPLKQLSARTQIVWIWDGAEYTRSIFGRDDSIHRVRETFATMEEKGSVRSLVDQELYVEPATALLRGFGITVIRAPYSAIAQCVYLLRERCVKYIFTKTDALYFRNGTKIIFDFKFTDNSLILIDRNDVFNQTGFNLLGFQSFSFLSGCELCPTVPIYADDFTASNIWSLAREGNLEESLHGYFSASTSSDEIEERVSSYAQQYYRSFVCVEYHPIMALSGRVECLINDNVPCDIGTIFGNALQDTLYQELFRCNLSTFYINRLAWEKQFVEPYNTKGLAVFRKVLEGQCKISEGNLVEILNRSFDHDVILLKNINKLIQVVFMALSRSEDAREEELLSLLNVGVKSSGGKVVRAPTPELFYFYIKLKSFILGLKDTMRMLRVARPTLEDLPFSLTFSDLLKEWQLPILQSFLRTNAQRDSSLNRFLDFLKE